MRKRVNFYLLLWIIMLMLSLGWPPAGGSQQPRLPLKTVALDPGHGGRDTGATGPSGTHEKDICLNLANLLAQKLTPAYKVVLTRSGDYSVDLDQRTAVANHQHADIFISLHTGAAFQHAAKGMAVYTYQPARKDDGPGDKKTDNGPIPWQQLQTTHLTQSRALAKALQTALENLDRAFPFLIQQGPLSVLQGADMPSILLEIGQLSNPESEKALSSEDQLRAYARAIAGAIDLFFATNP